MDKLLITSGAILTYAAYQNKQGNIITGIQKTATQKGFVGSMVIMGLLLTYAQYNPKQVKYPAMIAVMIALTFATKYRSNKK